MIVHSAGESALLVETGDTDHAHRLYAHIQAMKLAGVRELVPGLSSLLIVADPFVLDLEALASAIPTWQLLPSDRITGKQIVIDMTYDGPDLDRVAESTGLAREQVIARHSNVDYQVAFLGFAPGFGYLTGLDRSLSVPRLDSPRERVPRGSVAIADEMTVIYPNETPGGWLLIGHTDAPLFDPDKRPPNRLSPGDTVRFRKNA